MNKHAQSLALFVLLLPVIVFFLAFFIDSSIMYYEKNKLSNIIVDNLNVSIKKDIRDANKIKKVIEENDQDMKVDVLIDGDNIEIIGKGKKRNLFGKIIQLDIYKLNFDYCANYQNKIVKECKGDL